MKNRANLKAPTWCYRNKYTTQPSRSRTRARHQLEKGTESRSCYIFFFWLLFNSFFWLFTYGS